MVDFAIMPYFKYKLFYEDRGIFQKISRYRLTISIPHQKKIIIS